MTRPMPWFLLSFIESFTSIMIVYTCISINNVIHCIYNCCICDVYALYCMDNRRHCWRMLFTEPYYLSYQFRTNESDNFKVSKFALKRFRACSYVRHYACVGVCMYVCVRHIFDVNHCLGEYHSEQHNERLILIDERSTRPYYIYNLIQRIY